MYKNNCPAKLFYIYKNPDTLRYAIFHEIFEISICIQKNMTLCVTWRFYIQKSGRFAKSKTIFVTFYTKKSWHFALRDFAWNFFNWRRGVHFFARRNSLWFNVKHHFMALKWVNKFNGYHSPTVRQKYNSSYSLESRHWDLSNDAINFSYWHMIFFKAYILPRDRIFRVATLWLILNHPVWDWNLTF